MALNNNQRRYLRGLSHDLHPLVTVAERGLAPSVLKEIEVALNHHELIKIRISVADRDAKASLIDSLLENTGAELVQKIGHVVSIYRPNPEAPKVELPK
jgi:RNA-binding protein